MVSTNTIDGKSYEIKDATRIGPFRDPNGVCIEGALHFLSWGVFEKVLNAKEVKGQLGPIKFKFSPENVNALRDLKRCIGETIEPDKR